jgi:DNA recombination protein RmuC
MVEEYFFYLLSFLLIILLVLQVRTLISSSRMRVASEKIFQLSEQVLRLETHLVSLEKNQDKMEQSIREEMSRNREETRLTSWQMREEIGVSLKSFDDSISKRVAEMTVFQQKQADSFAQQIGTLLLSGEQRMETIRSTVEVRLREIQENNARKLEEIRNTVDEKLQTTLEKRLSESFQMVSERLEQVYKGLGEMQTLAVGVGDLKKVLANVKTRGIFGEVQLGNILEEILTPDQYLKNVATRKDSNEIVEYAVKLPGPDGQGSVLLPIDAKFPQEDYLRLLDAYEIGDLALVETAARNLESRIKTQAKEICNKYISAPETTDFGIMFLPTESLYAEVLRRRGLVETLNKDYKVNVTGPSTLAAFLNSLSVGFRTLAIQKQSGEVWTVLGAVKTEFNKYSNILVRVQKQLHAASNTIDDAQRRTRVLERKLKTVEELPVPTAANILGEIVEAEDLILEADIADD